MFVEDKIIHTRHGQDHLYPKLPLWHVVQDLYSTDPTQETCAVEQVDHAEYTAPTGRHELLL